MKKRWISPAEYRHGRYGLYGAFSIVSTLVVAGLLVLVNVAGLILAALASRR
ncbi:MAG: hypothetical protein UX02_C0001G0108 [Candidatus Moranbacteria bacterium GW2011_GWC1_45_18]|nr:MAG: hypothetical protein UT79_C0002G0289 [Candidatus Moranbacteria bacterium GW2011_GWC2_40_12]KKT34128.1 MAG: hypothetical protein UW19_C0001G0023 [Candidatus Moranbacteria bacterium GW2011_GWF2_44_10]KKT70285.1 MAG: hypothetical protein UW66_C0045G0002 [Candidatus Moranbacteria bacterium GW2011_GWF1_44_4]KKU00660.1 MAG: hypothetical protein UX02_C0001G0108 [Candidatus Moranbacteria bacterium GW2011_GWC1_45_18]